VCVPPPSWTNTLHRNGVKTLGTFLVEPQSANISKILQRTPSETQGWDYTLASQLTRIARFYGFDGWLINIEKTFPITDWSLSRLEGFLKQLGSSFDDGCVIFYDSLTRNNRIDYQTRQSRWFNPDELCMDARESYCHQSHCIAERYRSCKRPVRHRCLGPEFRARDISQGRRRRDRHWSGCRKISRTRTQRWNIRSSLAV
jgi:hypothetical protein